MIIAEALSKGDVNAKDSWINWIFKR
jgi:hypothetical protein